MQKKPSVADIERAIGAGLIRTDDTLLNGQVYRLISYEDVLKEVFAKGCVKLGKLLMEIGVIEQKKNDVTDA
ncbi:hypothetical protein Tco_0194177 [Tanacetum coccineum]